VSPRSHLSGALALLTAACLICLVPAASPPPEPTASEKPAAASTYRFSGPYTHENLTIYLIRGSDQLAGRKFLTLDEALEQKKVIVHETKNVGQLAIENVSDEEVFVQAGDIVKGGQQDRTIGNDQIVPPKSGRLPLASFCVEQGRWSARGGESDKQFSRSAHQLADNRSKLACRAVASQREVWANVARVQTELNKNLKTEVQGKASPTSLQLTLEHKKVTEAIDTFVKKLEATPAKETDVIGYAVAINGKVNNADVYANADLFKKLWPKLLRASAIEAVVNQKEGAKIAPVKVEDVQAFLAEAEKGKRTEKKLARELAEVQVEGKDNVLFETKTEGGRGAALRRSYIGK
jgi:hypothetical protein